MTAIFLFDIFAALIFPYLSGILGLTNNQFGILAGSAINDTSSVAAAEATYSVLNNIDTSSAITIKLTRTTMLIVVAIIFSIISIKIKQQVMLQKILMDPRRCQLVKL